MSLVIAQRRELTRKTHPRSSQPETRVLDCGNGRARRRSALGLDSQDKRCPVETDSEREGPGTSHAGCPKRMEQNFWPSPAVAQRLLLPGTGLLFPSRWSPPVSAPEHVWHVWRLSMAWPEDEGEDEGREQQEAGRRAQVPYVPGKLVAAGPCPLP